MFHAPMLPHFYESAPHAIGHQSVAVSLWILLGILCFFDYACVHARVLPSAHGTKPFNSLQSYYKSVDRQLSHRYPELNDAPYKMSNLEEAPKYLLQLMRLQSSRPPSNTVRGFQATVGEQKIEKEERGRGMKKSSVHYEVYPKSFVKL